MVSGANEACLVTLFLNCSKSTCYLCLCRLPTLTVAPLLQYCAPQHLPWAKQGSTHGWPALSYVLVNRTNNSSDPGFSLHPLGSAKLSQYLFSEASSGGPCPSGRSACVWQCSKLPEDGGQTAWLDMKSLGNEPVSASCPVCALASLFLPLLCVCETTCLLFQFAHFGTGL